jgi:hypothetical protein
VGNLFLQLFLVLLVHIAGKLLTTVVRYVEERDTTLVNEEDAFFLLVSFVVLGFCL